MMKIGEFARICNTTAQTIRFYDSEGLLPAEVTDADSGYRYYSKESVERYGRIVFYKELGFSLTEIKRIFTASDEEIRRIMLKKKNELSANAERSDAAAAMIERLCRRLSTEPPTAALPPLAETLTLPFTDHPEAVGRWELCGKLEHEWDIASVTDPRDIRGLSRTIFLLPHGAFAWNWFWTRGTLYRVSGGYPFAIPNEYRLTAYSGETYMLLRFVTNGCIERGEDAVPLLYRRADSTGYTESDIRKNTDNIDLPFVDDAAIHGDWRCVDYISHPSLFDPSRTHTPPERRSVTALRFAPRGICIRTVRGRRGTTDILLRFTLGTVINAQSQTAEAYFRKEVSETEYLFVEHKSGDYVYGGKTPHWYVFTRL